MSFMDFAKKNHFMRFIYSNYIYRTYLPKWSLLIEKDKAFWESKLKLSKQGPKILIATTVGSQLQSVIIESLLAVGLTLREAEVHVLLCDSMLTTCFTCHVSKYRNLKKAILTGPSRDYCKYCFPKAHKMYESLGVRIHRFSELLTSDDIKQANSLSADVTYDEIKEYSIDGLQVGEHALAGALRFYARGTLENEPYAETLLRHYLNASLLTIFSMKKLLRKYDFDCAVFSHGIYVPHGPIGEVCRNEKVRVVNWVPSYRKRTFIFSHYDTYHRTMMTEPIYKWLNIPWNKDIETELMNYLKSRWTGEQDWIWFSDDTPVVDPHKIAEKVGIDFPKPCIGLLTNVVWDAQLHYPENVFSNMLDWINKTIAYFEKRQDLQLLIRVHPAEIKGAIPSRQKVVDQIRRAYPKLPSNVFIIPPESKISTYAAMAKCNAVIIYGTKTGTELTSMGIPVIVAGEAWIRNKGITMDAFSLDNYYKLLDNLPLRSSLDEAVKERARKYAFHFFFRRMIPLDFIGDNNGVFYKINISSLLDIIPGKNKGLDIICDGILNSTDFIYPAELFIARKVEETQKIKNESIDFVKV